MIVGNILLRGSANKREEIKELLNGLIGRQDFYEKTGVIVDEVLATFGWSDFIIRLYGINAELIKKVVIMIRDMIAKILNDKFVETSTIIGITLPEGSHIIKDKNDFLKKFKDFKKRDKNGFSSPFPISGEIKEKINGYLSNIFANEIF